MPQRVIYYVIFIALVWRKLQATADKDEQIQNIFKDNITRADFSNLLQSLIKLNEQRVNVLQKLYKLEDYGVISEVLRSGDKKEATKKLNNLVLILLSKNQSNPVRRNMKHQHMNFVPKFHNKSIIDNQIPVKRSKKYKREENPQHKLNPAALSDNNFNLSDDSIRLLIGDALHQRILKHTRDKIHIGSPKINKLEEKNRNVKLPKVGRSVAKGEVKYRLKENDHTTKYPKEARRGVKAVDAYLRLEEDDRNIKFPKETRSDAKRNDHGGEEDRGRDDMNAYTSIEMYGEELLEGKIEPPVEISKNPNNDNFGLVYGAGKNPSVVKKRQDRFQIDDGRHAPTNIGEEKVEEDNPNMNYQKESRIEMNDFNYIKSGPGRSGSPDMASGGESTTNNIRIAKNSVKADGERKTKPHIVKDNIDQDKFEMDNGGNIELSAGQIKFEEADEPDNLNSPTIVKNINNNDNNVKNMNHKGNDNNVFSIEIAGESQSAPKKIPVGINKDEDGGEYPQSISEGLQSSMESRKNLQKCISKKALKLCLKSCNGAYKNVCRKLKCTSKAKKTLKKECKKSCKKTFHTKDKKHESSDSDY